MATYRELQVSPIFLAFPLSLLPVSSFEISEEKKTKKKRKNDFSDRYLSVLARIFSVRAILTAVLLDMNGRGSYRAASTNTIQAAVVLTFDFGSTKPYIILNYCYSFLQ